MPILFCIFAVEIVPNNNLKIQVMANYFKGFPIDGYQPGISKLLNSNFRVRTGRTLGYKLLGYSGLCSLLGYLRANKLILDYHFRLRSDKATLWCNKYNTTLTFYVK